MVMIFIREARQWCSLQPRGYVGVWICGACGRLGDSFHLVSQGMGQASQHSPPGFSLSWSFLLQDRRSRQLS
jgi:hypothetical protein